MENFEHTLRNLIWSLIEEKVKAEIENQANGPEQLTYESDEFSEKVNELISDYFTYNVSVSIDHWNQKTKQGPAYWLGPVIIWLGAGAANIHHRYPVFCNRLML